jgi:hypothetical protein
LTRFRQFSPAAVLSAFFASAVFAFRTRAALQLEILALRHQLGVLQRSVKKPKLNRLDRFLWAWICGSWGEWRSALCIVKPETVIGWHRKGFRLFWTWKVRRGQTGRPPVSKEIRELIRQMSRENPIWGAPRIHGELLKLGIDVGETSVSKYMVRRRNPLSFSEIGSAGTLASECDGNEMESCKIFDAIGERDVNAVAAGVALQNSVGQRTHSQC